MIKDVPNDSFQAAIRSFVFDLIWYTFKVEISKHIKLSND